MRATLAINAFTSSSWHMRVRLRCKSAHERGGGAEDAQQRGEKVLPNENDDNKAKQEINER